MAYARQSCCSQSIGSHFEEWCAAVGAHEHLWMRNNLKMVLNGTLGSSRMLDAEDMIVRVGWVAIPGELFTWSQRLQHGCPACGRTTDLIFLSSNAMFYLLRLLQTAAALFVAVPDDSGRPLVRCRSEASDDLIHQVHLAMEIYRGHRELSPAGLGELSRLFGTAPNPAQLAAAEMYHATVAWMLMHEVGHTVGPAPQARRYHAQNVGHRHRGPATPPRTPLPQPAETPCDWPKPSTGKESNR